MRAGAGQVGAGAGPHTARAHGCSGKGVRRVSWHRQREGMCVPVLQQGVVQAWAARTLHGPAARPGFSQLGPLSSHHSPAPSPRATPLNARLAYHRPLPFAFWFLQSV